MSDRPPGTGLLLPALAALLLTTSACSPPTADPPEQPTAPVAAAEAGPEAPEDTPDGGRSAEGAAPPRSLVAGEELTDYIEAGQRHRYAVTAQAGTAAAVEVAQRGADVVVRLRSPDGALLTRVDSHTGDYGTEHLFWISDVAGTYRVEVHLLEGHADRPGHYAVTLDGPPRQATLDDRLRVQAARTYAGGVEHLTQGRSGDAAAAFADAAARFGSLGDTLLEAGALFSAGETHRGSEEWRQALEPYRRAVDLYRRLDMPKEEALAHSGLGTTLRELHRYEAAIAAYESAWRLYEGLEEPNDEDRELHAVLLNNLGRMHSVLADSESALDCYERSLDLVAAADRDDGPKVLANLADEYRLNGDRERALRLYDRAFALARERGDAERTAWSLSKRCLTLHEMDLRDEAAGCIRRAVALHQEAGDRQGEAVSRVTLAQIAERQGDVETAREQQEAALEVFLGLGDEMSTAIVLNNLGWNDLAAGDPAAALLRFQAALPTIERLGRPRERADALAGLAKAYAGLDRLGDALDTNRRAIAVLEELRRGPAAPSLRALALARRHQTYAYQVELLMRQHERDPDGGWDARALTACEKARARTLLETLALFQSDGSTADSGPGAAERDLVDRLRTLEQRRSKLLWRGDEDAQDGLAQLDLEIEETELAWQRLRGGRAEAGAVKRSLTDPLDAAEIQRRSVDTDSLMLAYHLGAERSFLWLVSPERIESHVLPPRERIERLASRAHELAADSRRRTRRIPARRALQELSRLLLEPVAGRISGTRRLLVVGEGALLYVPFAALPLPGDGRPLVAAHEAVVLPSASTLAALRRRVAGRRPAPGTVAVVADPVYQPDDPRFGGPAPGLSDHGTPLQRSGESVKRLPHSRREAEAIRELVAPGERFVATGFDANLDTVLSRQLSGYRVVHLATHARVYADRASLLLSPLDVEGNDRPGELRSDQIYRMRLPTELVTLSACSTALGEQIPGEGLVGLTHGFLTAGAARVMVSLWNVGDESTAVLMERFYRRLFRQGLSPAAALRSAQLSMWHEEEWRAPYHWAGFVLQGEPQ